MEDEDRKILTEFLGECFHEIEDKGPYQSICSKCGMTLGAVHSSDWNPEAFNRTLDTWEDFGALWEALIEKGILGDFMKWLIKDSDCVAMAFVAWESWEPKERCIIILKAINEGVIK